MLDREHATALELRDGAEEIARVQREAIAAYFNSQHDLASETRAEMIAAALENATAAVYRHEGWLRLREISRERQRRRSEHGEPS